MNRYDFQKQSGIALVTVLIFLMALTAMYAAYYQITKDNIEEVKSSRHEAFGFYSAEAALNARAKDFRDIFNNFTDKFDLPTGTSPTTSTPCESGDNGSGDFVCISYTFDGRTVYTFVEDVTPNTPPLLTTIDDGDPFAGLSAFEFMYDVKALSKNAQNETEAILSMRFTSRRVPMFQFAAFYADDLEIVPSAAFTLNGPIHSNKNIFLGSSVSGDMNLGGPISAGENIYRGFKYTSSGGTSGTFRAQNPDLSESFTPWPGLTYSGGPSSSRYFMDDSNVSAFNGNIRTGEEAAFFADYGTVSYGNGTYWDDADLRIVMKLDSGLNPDTSCGFGGIEVQNANGSCNFFLTSGLTSCASTITHRSELKNFPEDSCFQVLDVHMANLLTCIDSLPLIAGGVNDDIALFIGFDSPVSGNLSVRLNNASTLITAGSVQPQSLTVATDLPMYVWDSYNSTSSVPAALIGERLWPLSNEWNDPAYLNNCTALNNLGSRVASTNITINAGLYLDTPNTCGAGLHGPQSCAVGDWNGGLFNFAVFQEDFSTNSVNFTVNGSIVSLNTPSLSTDPNGNDPSITSYVPNVTINHNPNLLFNPPPLAPQFVNLKQEYTIRYFE